jgi:hypothetical protein
MRREKSCDNDGSDRLLYTIVVDDDDEGASDDDEGTTITCQERWR